MIATGVRLTLASGRDAVVRLIAFAIAVGLGVGLLLTTLAGIRAVHAQTTRTAWLTTSTHNRHPSVDERTSDPLWATAGLDQYGTDIIERVDLAATGPRSPAPPGIPRLPGPGEFYASPALARLLASRPGPVLGDRYPGHLVGLIGPEALASPESLLIVIGHAPAELVQAGAHQIRSFETAAARASGDAHPGRMQLILAVVAGALLIPVLLFIAAASRLSAARREQRFAAIRLVGGTPGQVSLLAAVEASVAAILGVACGFAVFLALRSVLTTVPFTGQPFFRDDLSLHAADVVLVVAGVPIAAALASRLALRRVHISPLGVTRQVTSPAPRVWRIAPLLVGLAELAYFVGRRPATTTGQIRAYGAGFLLVMIGLVVAGPWLTMVGARVVARRARRPAALIAGRRLADNPRAAFRAVSGLIVALFVSSAALGVISTILAYHAASTGGAAGTKVLGQRLAHLDLGDDGTPHLSGVMLPAALVDQLRAIRGIDAVVVIHLAAAGRPAALGFPSGLVACRDLARVPVLGRCAPGASAASIDWLRSSAITTNATSASARDLPTAAISEAALAQLPVAAIDVATDGSRNAIERARTLLEVANPGADFPTTIGDISAENARLIAGWRQLAGVAIVASLIIAACGLAVSVAGGIIERKRPFSLLRLAGAPMAVLRSIVLLEAAVPLVVVAVLSIAAGFLAAHLFLRAQLEETLRLPGLGFYATVSLGIAGALGIIASTLPLLERITGPETARNE